MEVWWCRSESDAIWPSCHSTVGPIERSRPTIDPSLCYNSRNRSNHRVTFLEKLQFCIVPKRSRWNSLLRIGPTSFTFIVDVGL